MRHSLFLFSSWSFQHYEPTGYGQLSLGFLSSLVLKASLDVLLTELQSEFSLSYSTFLIFFLTYGLMLQY